MVERDGTTQHPERYERKQQKRVLAAVAGFPDSDPFDHVKGLFSKFPNSMQILLPSAEIIRDPEGNKFVNDFKDAVKMAGRQIVKGNVEDDVRAKLIVNYPPNVKNMIRERANKYFESRIKKE
jgi:hypothetical protein